MYLTVLRSKLDQVRVTHAELDYEGSCAIDAALLDAAGIGEDELVHIHNLENGERFSTYTIRGEPGSGIISVNGAAAHKVRIGDRLEICAYATLTPEQATSHRPIALRGDERNRLAQRARVVPAGRGLGRPAVKRLAATGAPAAAFCPGIPRIKRRSGRPAATRADRDNRGRADEIMLGIIAEKKLALAASRLQVHIRAAAGDRAAGSPTARPAARSP